MHYLLIQILLFALLIPLPNFCNQFYSQHGQDQFLYQHFFQEKQNGIFVEFGAHDGISFSNTYFFEKTLKWKGLCIEPIPNVFEKLKQNRTAICIQGCVSETSGTQDFIKLEGYSEMLSGLQEKYDPMHMQRIDHELNAHGGKKEILKVPCYTLNDLLEKNGLWHVDYLSVDTEGGELKILQSLDFNKFDIDIISVENNYKDSRFKEFMDSKGYVFIKTLGTDEIYKKPKVETHNSPPSIYFLRQFISSTPNVLEIDAGETSQALECRKLLRNGKFFITQKSPLKNSNKYKNVSVYTLNPNTLKNLDNWIKENKIPKVEFLILHQAEQALSLLEKSPEILKNLKVIDLSISSEENCMDPLKIWLEQKGFTTLYYKGTKATWILSL